MVNNRDAVHDFQLDFAQILCTQGLSVAAVIAVELLRQERNPGTSADPLPRMGTKVCANLTLLGVLQRSIRNPDAM